MQSKREIATADLNDDCAGLVFSSDGRRIITSTEDDDGELTLWQVPSLVQVPCGLQT